MLTTFHLAHGQTTCVPPWLSGQRMNDDLEATTLRLLIRRLDLIAV
jgi:hypothetical protein